MNYAGFWRRFVASFIDGLILMIPSLVLGFVFQGGPASMGVGFILGILYRPFFESSILMGTPGKALMGISVVTEAGARLSFKQALIRFACTYLSVLILFIGYLMQPFTVKRQTLHDLIAETVVIKNDTNPDLNYFTVWRDHFKEVIAKLYGFVRLN